VDIPQASLTTSSTYYARVQYATTNTQSATSSFSNWNSFVAKNPVVTTWSGPVTAPSGGLFNSTAYATSLNLWVAGGRNSGSTASTVYTSTDGISWTERVLPSAATVTGGVTVSYGEPSGSPLLLAYAPFANATCYWTSTDGINWTQRTTFPSLGGNFLSLTQWVPGLSAFYAYGYKSTDGVNWTSQTWPGSYNTSSPLISYVGSTLYWCNRVSPTVYKSTDGGANWSTITINASYSIDSQGGIGATSTGPIIPKGSIGGNQRSAYSGDAGATWTTTGAEYGAGNFYDQLVYGSGTYLAAGSLSVSQTTDNGATWTTVQPDAANGTANFLGFSTNGSRVLVVKGNGTNNTYTIWYAN
jgi:hypothetical protein